MATPPEWASRNNCIATGDASPPMPIPPIESHRLRLVAFAAILAVVSGAALAADAETDRLAAAGERLLAEQCARCHATSNSGDSPLAAAPPFRSLGAKYPIDSLAEALAEGITTGHPEMPEFVFSADEIAAILAHIDRISEPAARR